MFSSSHATRSLFISNPFSSFSRVSNTLSTTLSFTKTLKTPYHAENAFPKNVEYMDRVNENNEAPQKRLPYSKMPKHMKQHLKMRGKQLHRMRRGLEPYFPVNNTLVAQKLDAYGKERRVRMAMIVYDSVVQRGGFFSHTNYQKFLKVIGMRCGCFDEAKTVFDHYKDVYPQHERQLFVYNQMIQACRGSPKAALQFYQEIVDTPHMVPTTHTFNFLLQSLLKPLVRYTAMDKDDVQEMHRLRMQWGSLETSQGDVNPDAPVAAMQQQVDADRDNFDPEEHKEELRHHLRTIIRLIINQDPVIFANTYVQSTIEELSKMPVFQNYKTLLKFKQKSGKVSRRKKHLKFENRTYIQDQLAKAYVKSYTRHMKRAHQKFSSTDQEDLMRKISRDIDEERLKQVRSSGNLGESADEKM